MFGIITLNNLFNPGIGNRNGHGRNGSIAKMQFRSIFNVRKGHVRLENKINGKKIMVLGLVAVLLIGVVAFVAFSAGGQNGKLSEKKIIGRWQSELNDNYHYDTATLEFKKDGIVVLSQGNEEDMGQWSITEGEFVVLSGFDMPISLKYADGCLTTIDDGNACSFYKIS